MYLAIDQFGGKTILEDIKHKTLKQKFFCGRIEKMYIDSKEGDTYQTGFILGQGRGYEPLWISVYHIKPLRIKQ